MKLLVPMLILVICALGAWAGPVEPVEAEGPHGPPYYALANYLHKRAEATALDRELLAEYLASLGSPDYPDIETDARAKRWWGGNKYKDNKSYGFWITALNKAGNYKRGKRAAPFIPAMGALQDDHNPLTGSSDYSSSVELIPDQEIPVEN